MVSASALPLTGSEGIAAVAPGVVVLHPDHTLAAITGEAQRLLAGMADYSATSGRLPAAVYSAAACLQSIDRGTAAPGFSPTARVRTVDGGWLLVHATHLHGSVDDDIAVIIESAHPSSTAPLVLSSLGLTRSRIRSRSAGVARGIHQGNRRRAAPVHVHSQRSSEVDLRQDRGTQSA